MKDAHPLPSTDACIEKVGEAKSITKLDLMKGFYKIGLTSRAQEIASFSALGDTFFASVLPFGLHNALATFQRLIYIVLFDVSNVAVYLDDIICYSNSWPEHVDHLTTLFSSP